MNSPKVFISHASEDKKRFATEFARRLREQCSVDAWFDLWEIKPGDSHVDKIFEEGMKEAQAVIIVLSQASVQKPWVRKELNTAVVNSINNGTRLIPVVIDNCEVPESLKSVRYEKIDDLTNYDQPLQRILAAIFNTDVCDKPPVGQLPARLSAPAPLISGLTQVDDLVMRVIAKVQVDEGAGLVRWERLRDEPTLQDVPQQELLDSLDILEERRYIKIERTLKEPSHVMLTDCGFQQFAQVHVNDYPDVVARIATLLLNENVCQSKELATRVNKPCTFVNFVLNRLVGEKYIEVSKPFLNGQLHVVKTHASLRRDLMLGGGRRLIGQGITSREEVLRVTSDA